MISVGQLVFDNLLLSSGFKLGRELGLQTGKLVLHAFDLAVFIQRQFLGLILLVELIGQIIRVERLSIPKRQLDSVINSGLLKLLLKLADSGLVAGDLTLKLLVALGAFFQISDYAVGRFQLGRLAV